MSDGNPLDNLFRQEAIDGRRQRYFGKSLISTRDFFTIATVVLVVIALSAMTYAGQSSVPRQVRAVGQLLPAGGVFHLTAPSDGVVGQMLAANGERVLEGQPIASLKSGLALSEGDGTVQDVQLEVARALLQASNADGIAQSDVAVQSREEAKARLEGVESELELAKRVLPLAEARLASAEAQVISYESLVAQGFGSQVRKRQLEDAAGDARLQLLAADRDVARQSAERLRLQAEIRRLRTEALIAQRASERAQLVDRASEARASGGATTIVRANATGRLDAPELRVGKDFQQGTLLGRILGPGPLEVSAMVDASRIYGVRPGADAQVQITSFEPTRLSGMPGRVVSVSENAAPPDDLARSRGITGPYYLVRVRLEPPAKLAREAQSLRAGMTVTVTIVTDRQSLLSIIFNRG